MAKLGSSTAATAAVDSTSTRTLESKISNAHPRAVAA
jgi:hypothetical protein